MKFLISPLNLLCFLALLTMSAAPILQAGEYSQKNAKQQQMPVADSIMNDAQKSRKNHKNKASKTSGQLESSAIIIEYDKVSDNLTLKAEAVSLKGVLSRIAKLSGIEVLFDDAAETSITVDIQSDTLETGLKSMLKGRNSALRYSRDDNDKLLLVGVTVLPAGMYGGGHAKRVKPLRMEAYDRAITLTLEQTQQMDLARQRWQARMSQISPEKLAKLEERVNARLLKEAVHKQRKAERKKLREERLAKIESRRKELKEKQLENLTPEQRAHYDQVRAEARERVRQLMYGSSQ